jgi:hypothetical protein
VTFFSHTRPWGSSSLLPCCAAHPLTRKPSRSVVPPVRRRCPSLALPRCCRARRLPDAGDGVPAQVIRSDRSARHTEVRRTVPPPLLPPEGVRSGSGSPPRSSSSVRRRTVETALRASASLAWPPVSGWLVPARRPGYPGRPTAFVPVGVVPGVCTVLPCACYSVRGSAPPGSGPGLVVRLASACPCSRRFMARRSLRRQPWLSRDLPRPAPLPKERDRRLEPRRHPDPLRSRPRHLSTTRPFTTAGFPVRHPTRAHRPSAKASVRLRRPGW